MSDSQSLPLLRSVTEGYGQVAGEREGRVESDTQREKKALIPSCRFSEVCLRRELGSGEGIKEQSHLQLVMSLQL